MLESFLKKLGLSNYETKVYLTLLKYGTLKVRDLSQKSGVPYGRIYDVVNTLKNKDIISFVSLNPKLLKALELEEALNLLLKDKEESIALLKKEKGKIIKQTEVKHKKIEEDYVYVFLGRKASHELYGKIVRDTKKELLVVSRSYYFHPDTSKLLDKNIAYKVIIQNLDKEIIPHVLRAYKKGAKIKVKNLKGFGIWIRDETECLFVVVNPKDMKSRISVLVKNEDFAKSMKLFFNSAWKEAEKVNFSKIRSII